jgi:hypothetical protein
MADRRRFSEVLWRDDGLPMLWRTQSASKCLVLEVSDGLLEICHVAKSGLVRVRSLLKCCSHNLISRPPRTVT